MKRCLLLGALLLVTSGGGVDSARAGEPFELAFDQGRLELDQSSGEALDYGKATSGPVSMTGSIEDGSLTVPAGNIDFPDVAVSAESVGSITFSTWAADDATGTFDAESGQMDLDLTLMIKLSNGSGSDCLLGPVSFDLSTEFDGSPSGSRFALGSEGDGAIGGLKSSGLVANSCSSSSDLDMGLWLGVTQGAKPFRITFDRTDLQFGPYPLLQQSPGTKLQGRVKNGLVTIPPGGVTIPNGSLADNGRTLRVELNSPGGATGSFDSVSGRLDLNLDLGLTVLNEASSVICSVGSVPVQLSTEYRGASTGVRFSGGLTRGLLGGGWSGLPQVVNGSCSESVVSAFSNAGLTMTLAVGDLSEQPGPDPDPEPCPKCNEPPPTPKPDLQLTAVRKKVSFAKKQKKVALKVNLRNKGDAAADKVRLCFSGPGWLLKKKTCQTFKSLSPGASVNGSVTIAPKRTKKARKANVKATVTASGAATRSVTINVKVPKR